MTCGRAPQGGDSTNPTYWLRRMGLIESSSPASSAKRSNAPAAEQHTAQIGSPSRARARHVRLPASGARSTSRRHSRSQRAALAAVAVATPAQQASAPPVLATHIAAGVRACTTRAGGEEIDTALMRDVMLAGRSCASVSPTYLSPSLMEVVLVGCVLSEPDFCRVIEKLGRLAHDQKVRTEFGLRT